MEGVEPLDNSSDAPAARAADDPAYEHCHEAPVLFSDRHARGIIAIHERIGCSFDTCNRLRAARLYLGSVE